MLNHRARRVTPPNPPLQGVDRQRRNIQDYDDPYTPTTHYEEGTRCPECRAIYHDQRWTMDEAIVTRLTVEREQQPMVVCPACRKSEMRDPGGIVTLRGGFWREHRDEVLNLIRNEEERTIETNPHERLMDIAEEGDHLVVWTTNEKLAQRLGRALEKAYDGELEYQWPVDNKLVRVNWSRDR
jgi:NMD protein affecting ribosome stability and mRNA decay